MSEKILLNVVAVTNTKLAACLWSLGFAWKGDMVHSSRGGPLAVQFLFQGVSQRPEYVHLSLPEIVKKHEAKTLPGNHPLAIMMAANHNYDRLLDLVKKSQWHRLCSIAEGRLFLYRPGMESPAMMHAESRVLTYDLELAACLGLVGIPVVFSKGSDGQRCFEMPCFGYARLNEMGVHKQEDTIELSRRAPTAEDPLRLALEDVDPRHPVVLGYDALFARTRLKKMLEKKTPLLLIEQSGTPRQALITMNSAGRVMGQVEKHMKSPPVFPRE